MKTLLIIGGSGFLGKSFLDYCKKKSFIKWKINKIIFISRKGMNIENIKKKNRYLISVKKNILNLKKIPTCDYIIYAANSKNNKGNLKGLISFKKLLSKNQKKLKILFTSSGAVYGPRSELKKIQENDIVSIKNINTFKGYKKNYGKTKIQMENLFKNFGKKGFNVSIARLFSFFSKRILVNNQYAVSDMINTALKFKFLKIKSKKRVYRSYMCSRDLVEWLMAILLSSNKKCPIYNVGSDHELTIEQLGSRISRILDVKLVKNKIVENKIDYYVPSLKKIKKNLKVNIKQNFFYELKKNISVN